MKSGSALLPSFALGLDLAERRGEARPGAPAVAGSSGHLLWFAIIMLLALGLSLHVIVQPDAMSIFWPPSGILLGWLLRHPRRKWTAIAGTAFAVHVLAESWMGFSLNQILGYPLIATAEAVLAAWLVQRLGSPDISLNRSRDVLALLAVPALLVFPLSALVATGITVMADTTLDFWSLWLVWLNGEVLGTLAMVPMVVAWPGLSLRSRVGAGKNATEAAFVLVVSIAVSAVFVTSTAQRPIEIMLLLLLPFVLLLWAAARLEVVWVAALCALFTLAAVLDASYGDGILGAPAGNVAERMFALQCYLGGLIASAWTLAVNASEGKSNRRALLTNSEYFRSLVENISDVICVIRDDGNILYASASVENVLGHRPEALMHTNGWAMVHPDDLGRVRGVFMELATKPGVTGPMTEVRLRRRNGSWCEMEALGKCLAGEAEHGMLVLNLRDISERKKSQSKQKDLETQLLRTQRMETIGTLAGGIAHDLNNILSPILMGYELLRSQPLNKREAHIIETIGTSTKRGIDLVKQVLSFARGADSQRIELHPGSVITEVRRVLRAAFPSSIRFGTEVAPDLWWVAGDPTQLHQVLLNLCVNARDAMPDGGRLTVRAENVRVTDPIFAMVGSAQPGPYVVISVSDTGCGIPVEIRENIFDPFFTTKAPDKGTGLGLSTTVGIVKGHGGIIDFESEIGRGTTFKVYLPAITEEDSGGIRA